MIAVIVEVEPAEGRMYDYLAVATKMRPLLEQQDGFIVNRLGMGTPYRRAKGIPLSRC